MRGRRAPGVLAAVLLLGACADVVDPPDVGTPSSQLAPVPDGLEEGCPPPDTPLRFPEGDLPPDPVAVRLCSGEMRPTGRGSLLAEFQAPVDELQAGAPALADLVDELSAVGQLQDCPYDGGFELAFWFRYADGDARAVSYTEGGCHTIHVGQELRRDRGEDVAAAFADALLAQRTATQPSSGASARLECSNPFAEPVSVLPLTPSQFVAARWCVGVGPSRIRSTEVPAHLLERVRTGLLGATVDVPDECRPLPYWRSIEGLTAWGDRVSLPVPDCSVYVRTGYGRDQMFTLYAADPDVLAALEALPLGPVERFAP